MMILALHMTLYDGDFVRHTVPSPAAAVYSARRLFLLLPLSNDMLARR